MYNHLFSALLANQRAVFLYEPAIIKIIDIAFSNILKKTFISSLFLFYISICFMLPRWACIIFFSLCSTFFYRHFKLRRRVYSTIAVSHQAFLSHKYSQLLNRVSTLTCTSTQYTHPTSWRSSSIPPPGRQSQPSWRSNSTPSWRSSSSPPPKPALEVFKGKWG